MPGLRAAVTRAPRLAVARMKAALVETVTATPLRARARETRRGAATLVMPATAAGRTVVAGTSRTISRTTCVTTWTGRSTTTGSGVGSITRTTGLSV